RTRVAMSLILASSPPDSASPPPAYRACSRAASAADASALPPPRSGSRGPPAGVQRVFTGRVGGVRFGATSDEIWVAVPGSVQRVAWRDNRTLARMRLDGRAGVHSLVVAPPRKAGAP